MRKLFAPILKLRFNLATLLLTVVLVVLIILPIQFHYQQRHSEFGSIESLHFSPNSKVLLIDTLLQDSLAGCRGIHCWTWTEKGLDQKVRVYAKVGSNGFLLNSDGVTDERAVLISNDGNKIRAMDFDNPSEQFTDRELTPSELQMFHGRGGSSNEASSFIRAQIIDFVRGDNVQAWAPFKLDLPKTLVVYRFKDESNEHFRLIRRRKLNGKTLGIESIDEQKTVLAFLSIEDLISNAHPMRHYFYVNEWAANGQFFVLQHWYEVDGESVLEHLLLNRELEICCRLKGEHDLLRFSENGQFLAWMTDDSNRISVVECTTGKLLFDNEIEPIGKLPIKDFVIDNEGEKLAVAYENAKYYLSDSALVWNIRQNQLVHKVGERSFSYPLYSCLVLIWAMLWGRLCLKPFERTEESRDLTMVVAYLFGIIAILAFNIASNWVDEQEMIFVITGGILVSAFVLVPNLTRRSNNSNVADDSDLGFESESEPT